MLNLNLWLLNIRGLNKTKLQELYNSINIGELDIVCLTETHEKCCSVQIPKCYNYATRRRDLKDKKGGGLMIQMGKKVIHKVITTRSSDLLFIEVEIRNITLKILLVYMDVTNEERNVKIRRELNEILEQSLEEDNLIILGDFNGHVGFIGPQDINRNGKYVLELMEKYNLILVNGDDRCNGEITREENGFKSAIDFILVNNNMYNKYNYMEIDEDKNIYRLSDHCLLKMNIELNVVISNKIRKREEVEYYDTRDTHKEAFLDEFVESARRNDMDMEEFNNLLGTCADKVLKRKYTRKLKEHDNPQAEWFSQEMKESIKKRQHYNRLVRNTRDVNEKNEYRILYEQQKAKTSLLIRNGILNYEATITKKIKERSNNKEIWKNINKLRRREEIKNEAKLYDDEGREIDEGKIAEVICKFWKNIYQPDNDELNLVWNEDEKNRYIRDIEMDKIKIELPGYISEENREQFRALRGKRQVNSEQTIRSIEIPSVLIEHYDMIGRANNKEYIRKMRKINFTQEDVKKQITRIKTGKQPGPDGLKPEIYKWLIGNEYCLSLLTECMNGILDRCDPPVNWKRSKTTLILKKNKPKSNELRPIALTDVSYKIFMGICKSSLVSHLQEENRISSYQSGFTAGRRIEDNILMLKYCITESYISGSPLILTAIDFTKAFDSIDRQKMINTLKYYKCDPNLIETIARLYSNDSTNLYFNNKSLGHIEIKSGIRQGCTGSPWLFVMVVNQIIDRILDTRIGFRAGDRYIPALFYADDGILLARSIKDARALIGILEKAAKEIGLEINRKKCNILVVK